MKRLQSLLIQAEEKIIKKDLLYFLKKRKIDGATLDVIDGEWLSKINLKSSQ